MENLDLQPLNKSYPPKRLLKMLSIIGRLQGRREKSEETYPKADMGWLLYSQLSEKYEGRISPDVLFDCAARLLDNPDNYIVNTAWGILALPTVISYIAEDEKRFGQVCKKIEAAIPDESNLPEEDERTPVRYNFLWAEIVRLGLESEAKRLGKTKFSDDLSSIQRKIGEKHSDLLTKCCNNDSDLDGTPLKMKYGKPSVI